MTKFVKTEKSTVIEKTSYGMPKIPLESIITFSIRHGTFLTFLDLSECFQSGKGKSSISARERH